ncbi:MAG: PDZ domain-containing protein [Deltaproteobacteria bacterium]|nr:PDZ domain-containing protein [Deltaproteobacteria bacterium]
MGSLVRRHRFPTWPFLLPLVLGVALVAAGSRARDADDDEDYRLSSLRVFNRVVLLVKEQYVEPQRIRPKEMLVAALDSVEKYVPEVLVEEGRDEVVVVVGAERRPFPLDDVTSLWELSFKLRDVFRFLETRISTDVDRRDVEYAAVNGMLSKLDPHSVLLEPKFSQEMKLNTKGEFGGLGIVISIRDGALTVISPIDGTPADRAGVKAQDKIVKIGEESTVNMGLDEAVERLRGKPGTTVVVWILRKGWDEPQRFDIVRAVIKVDSVTHQLLDETDKQAGRIGYVKIKQFQGHTAEDVAEAVVAMEKQAGKRLAGLVLDLRNNPGGLLEQAVEVSNLFMTDGVLVITQDGGSAGERREIRAQGNRPHLDHPLIVLVNGGSASASEIVAGAIKNRGRGLIVGDQTFGKGSVQQLYDFPDQSSLKLTIGQYLTPGDESIQSVGITPDVDVLAVQADDKDDLNLFPDEHTREEDLDRHLDDARTRKHESRYQLAYLAEQLSEDERERRDVSTKFAEDFEIRFARRLVTKAPFTSRDRQLEAIKAVIDEVSAEEDARIDAALSKLGIDWSREPATTGKLAAAPATGALTTTVVAAEPADAGGTLKVTVQAKNTGATPLYRVRANTQATMGLFSDHELLFGKLDAGQAREWTVTMKVPKELQSRRDLVRLTFGDERAKLATLDVPVTINAVARPRFSYALFIDDTRGGNGDGLLQAGESVELVVSIKNAGTGPSEEPTALLKNLGGSETFIETGRQKLEALKPASAGVARFGFKVQPEAGKAPPKADLRLQVFDAVTGDVLVERLQFPIKAAQTEVKKKKGVVEATGATTVLAAADGTAPVLAHAEGGTRFDAVAEVNGFVRVKLGSMYGYVAQNGVGPSKGKAAVGADGQPQGLSWVYGRDPPHITFPGGALAVVEGDTFTVEARIEDDGPVKDGYLFVDDQKVYFEAFKASRGPTNTVLKREVKLKPGVNVITVVAREDDEFAQREVMTVYSKKGDPLAKGAR